MMAGSSRKAVGPSGSGRLGSVAAFIGFIVCVAVGLLLFSGVRHGRALTSSTLAQRPFEGWHREGSSSGALDRGQKFSNLEQLGDADVAQTEDPEVLEGLTAIVLHLVVIGDELSLGESWSSNFRQRLHDPFVTRAIDVLRKHPEILMVRGVRAITISGEKHGFTGRGSGGVASALQRVWPTPREGGTGREAPLGEADRRPQRARRLAPNADALHVAVCSVMVGTHDAIAAQSSAVDVDAYVRNVKAIHRRCVASHRLFHMGMQHRKASNGEDMAERFILRRAPLVILSIVTKLPPVRFDPEMLKKLDAFVRQNGSQIESRYLKSCFLGGGTGARKALSADVERLNDAITEHVHAELVSEASVQQHEHELEMEQRQTKQSSREGPIIWHVADETLDFGSALEHYRNGEKVSANLWSDCIHPDSAGYRAMGDFFAERVAAMLPEVLDLVQPAL